MISNEAVTQSAVPGLNTWNTCTYTHPPTHTHTLRENTHTDRIPGFTHFGEGVRESHEEALTLVIIVHSERMSRSEPRKPLNFPPRERMKEWTKWGKRGGRGQMEREKEEKWQNVCQMRKGGKMKRTIRFPVVLHWLLKGLSQQLQLRSLSTQLLLADKQQIVTQSRWVLWKQPPVSTWPKLLNSADLKLMYPGVCSHCVGTVCQDAEEFDVNVSQLLVC